MNRGAVHRKVSGSYTSMILRMGEIVDLFEGSEGSSFLLEFADVMNPDDMAERLGLFKHPLYQEAYTEGRRFCEKRKLLGSFLYALDITSQHAILKANKKKRMREAELKKQAVEKWRRSEGNQQAFSSNLVEQSAVSEHLQMFLQKQPSNIMLSVPASESVGHFTLTHCIIA